MNNDNIYLVLKSFENSLISTFGQSDKPETLGYSDFLEIISHLEKREFIEETEDSLFKITLVGSNKLKELDNIKKQKEIDDNAERKKLHNEAVISEMTRKTFLIVFIFGLLGGLYSSYDFFISDPKNEKRFQEIEKDILKNKDTIKELRTLILNQKKVDSLNHSSSELNK